MKRAELSLAEAVAPIVRRAAVEALHDPRLTADALFFLGDALDELAGQIALTAAMPESETSALTALAVRARTLAAARVTR